MDVISHWNMQRGFQEISNIFTRTDREINILQMTDERQNTTFLILPTHSHFLKTKQQPHFKKANTIRVLIR